MNLQLQGQSTNSSQSSLTYQVSLMQFPQPKQVFREEERKGREERDRSERGDREREREREKREREREREER